MSGEIPGKVVLFDDQFEDVQDLMFAFMKKGEACIYVNDSATLDGAVSGVRLIILDLDIDGDGQVTDGDIKQIALFLYRLLGDEDRFLLIAIWSIQIDKSEEGVEYIKKIEAEYQKITGEYLNAIFLPSKSKKIDRDTVLKEIRTWIGDNPSQGLLFEWDRILEAARDMTLKEVIDLEGNSISALVAQLFEDAKGTPVRELVELIGKVLLGKLTAEEHKGVNELIDAIRKKPIGEVDPEWYSRFYRFQAYSEPVDDAPIWTGDIINLEGTANPNTYGVVLSPKCDFQQDKAQIIRVAHAIRVNGTVGSQNAGSMLVSGNVTYDKSGSLTDAGRDFLGKIAGGSHLPDFTHVLRYIQSNGDHFHLLIDLRDVRPYKLEDVDAKWRSKRILRLESPYIEDLLQHFASLVARVGVPDIPDGIRKAEKKRLEVKPGEAK